MIITTFNSITDHRGTRESLSYDDLLLQVSGTVEKEPYWYHVHGDDPTPDLIAFYKWNQPGWSPASFINDTRSDSVDQTESVCLLVFDIDSHDGRQFSAESAFKALKMSDVLRTRQHLTLMSCQGLG